jgi:hypothetical protein
LSTTITKEGINRIKVKRISALIIEPKGDEFSDESRAPRPMATKNME